MPGEAWLLCNTSRNHAACEEKGRVGGKRRPSLHVSKNEIGHRRARYNSAHSPPRAPRLFPLDYLISEPIRCPAHKIVPGRSCPGGSDGKHTVTSGYEGISSTDRLNLCHSMFISLSAGHTECRLSLRFTCTSSAGHLSLSLIHI